jgi:hypothetical protein
VLQLLFHWEQSSTRPVNKKQIMSLLTCAAQLLFHWEQFSTRPANKEQIMSILTCAAAPVP